MRKMKQQSGFTIIELLVATTIFSIVLVVIVASFLQVGRMFYKGVSVNNTNESARNLVDEISNDVRLSPSFTAVSADSSDATKKFFCVGSHRYTFKLNKQVKAGDIAATARTMGAGVIQDVTSGNCQDPTALLGSSPRQVLGPDMQINVMDIVQNSAGTGMLIRTHVIFYGVDSTVFDTNNAALKNTAGQPSRASTAPDAFCSGNILSTQFCAVADINTNVTLRY